MRVTGGDSKGRRLAPPKGLRIRPTSDKVKEAIFNLIGQDVDEQRVLDLFSGTGGLGIEALSRGASEAIFIDHALQAVTLIKKNLSICGYENRGIVLKADLRRGLPSKDERMKNPFGLAFIDPPYGKDLIPPLLRDLCDKRILAASSIIVAETSKFDMLPESYVRLRTRNVKTYGETKLTIYEYEDEQ
jgi:16S rRNA (guanine966-N2)-methyltransferase